MHIKLDINNFGFFVIQTEESSVIIYPQTFSKLVDFISEYKVSKISDKVYNAVEYSQDWHVLSLSSALIRTNDLIASYKLENQPSNLIN